MSFRLAKFISSKGVSFWRSFKKALPQRQKSSPVSCPACPAGVTDYPPTSFAKRLISALTLIVFIQAQITPYLHAQYPPTLESIDVSILPSGGGSSNKMFLHGKMVALFPTVASDQSLPGLSDSVGSDPQSPDTPQTSPLFKLGEFDLTPGAQAPVDKRFAEFGGEVVSRVQENGVRADLYILSQLAIRLFYDWTRGRLFILQSDLHTRGIPLVVRGLHDVVIGDGQTDIGFHDITTHCAVTQLLSNKMAVQGNASFKGTLDQKKDHTLDVKGNLQVEGNQRYRGTLNLGAGAQLVGPKIRFKGAHVTGTSCQRLMVESDDLGLSNGALINSRGDAVLWSKNRVEVASDVSLYSGRYLGLFQGGAIHPAFSMALTKEEAFADLLSEKTGPHPLLAAGRLAFCSLKTDLFSSGRGLYAPCVCLNPLDEGTFIVKGPLQVTQSLSLLQGTLDFQGDKGFVDDFDNQGVLDTCQATSPLLVNHLRTTHPDTLKRRELTQQERLALGPTKTGNDRPYHTLEVLDHLAYTLDPSVNRWNWKDEWQAAVTLQQLSMAGEQGADFHWTSAAYKAHKGLNVVLPHRHVVLDPVAGHDHLMGAGLGETKIEAHKVTNKSAKVYGKGVWVKTAQGIVNQGTPEGYTATKSNLEASFPDSGISGSYQFSRMPQKGRPVIQSWGPLSLDGGDGPVVNYFGQLKQTTLAPTTLKSTKGYANLCGKVEIESSEILMTLPRWEEGFCQGSTLCSLSPPGGPSPVVRVNFGNWSNGHTSYSQRWFDNLRHQQSEGSYGGQVIAETLEKLQVNCPKTFVTGSDPLFPPTCSRNIMGISLSQHERWDKTEQICRSGAWTTKTTAMTVRGNLKETLQNATQSDSFLIVHGDLEQTITQKAVILATRLFSLQQSPLKLVGLDDFDPGLYRLDPHPQARILMRSIIPSPRVLPTGGIALHPEGLTRQFDPAVKFICDEGDLRQLLTRQEAGKFPSEKTREHIGETPYERLSRYHQGAQALYDHLGHQAPTLIADRKAPSTQLIVRKSLDQFVSALTEIDGLPSTPAIVWALMMLETDQGSQKVYCPVIYDPDQLKAPTQLAPGIYVGGKASITGQPGSIIHTQGMISAQQRVSVSGPKVHIDQQRERRQIEGGTQEVPIPAGIVSAQGDVSVIVDQLIAHQGGVISGETVTLQAVSALLRAAPLTTQRTSQCGKKKTVTQTLVQNQPFKIEATKGIAQAIFGQGGLVSGGIHFTGEDVLIKSEGVVQFLGAYNQAEQTVSQKKGGGVFIGSKRIQTTDSLHTLMRDFVEARTGDVIFDLGDGGDLRALHVTAHGPTHFQLREGRFELGALPTHIHHFMGTKQIANSYFNATTMSSRYDERLGLPVFQSGAGTHFALGKKARIHMDIPCHGVAQLLIENVSLEREKELTAQLKEDPDLEWLALLKGAYGGKLEIDYVSERHEHSHLHVRALSPVLATAIALATTVATMGAGASLMGMATTAATATTSGAIQAAMVSAAFTGVMTQSALAVAGTAVGDERAFQKSFNEDALKGLALKIATAGVQAGALHGLSLDGERLVLVDKIKANLIRAAISQGVSHGIGEGTGSSTGAAFASALVTALSEEAVEGIGGLKNPVEGEGISSVSHKLLHGLQGAGAGVLEGSLHQAITGERVNLGLKAAGGAAGAIIAETLIEQFADPVESLTPQDLEKQKQAAESSARAALGEGADPEELRQLTAVHQVKLAVKADDEYKGKLAKLATIVMATATGEAELVQAMFTAADRAIEHNFLLHRKVLQTHQEQLEEDYLQKDSEEAESFFKEKLDPNYQSAPEFWHHHSTLRENLRVIGHIVRAGIYGESMLMGATRGTEFGPAGQIVGAALGATSVFVGEKLVGAALETPIEQTYNYLNKTHGQAEAEFFMMSLESLGVVGLTCMPRLQIYRTARAALQKTGKVSTKVGTFQAPLVSGFDKTKVWDLNPLKRGEKIERFLAKTEYSFDKGWYNVGADNWGMFPLVDFQKGNTLVSLKTVDTRGIGWMARMERHIEDLSTRGAKVDRKSAEMMLDLRVQPGGFKDAKVLLKFAKKFEDNPVRVEISEFGS